MSKANDWRRTRRKGLGMLDTMLALGIGALASAGVLQLTLDSHQALVSAAVADKMNMMRSAAQVYLRANYGQLMENLPVGETVSIPLTGSDTIYGAGSLAANHELPDDFVPTAPNGQSYAFLVHNFAATASSNAHLEGLVITYGGDAMSDRQIGLAVEKMGAQGGGVKSSNVGPQDDAVVAGAYGLWSYPASAWATTTGYAPAAGHLAEIVDVTGRSQKDYLDRFYVGLDAMNTMYTDVDMDQNGVDTMTLVDGYNGNDISIGSSSSSANVRMANGAFGCNSGASGCGIAVGSAGGMYDYNNGWIAFTASGIRINGNGDNLSVEGTTAVESTLNVDVSLDLKNAGPVWQDGAGNDVSAQNYTSDGENYWFAAQGNGMANIMTPMMNAAKYITSSDLDGTATYYMVPDSSSYLDYLHMVSGYIQDSMSVAGSAAIGNSSDASASVGGATTVSGNLEAAKNIYTNGLTSNSIQGVLTNRGVINNSAYIGSSSKTRASLNADGTAEFNAYQYAKKFDATAGDYRVTEGDVSVGGDMNAYYSQNGQSYIVTPEGQEKLYGDVLTVFNVTQMSKDNTATVGMDQGSTYSSTSVRPDETYDTGQSSVVANGNLTVRGNLNAANVDLSGPYRVGMNMHFLYENNDAAGHASANGANCTSWGGTGSMVTAADRSSVAYCDANSVTRLFKLSD